MLMTEIETIDFNNIVNDILKNEEFIELKYELHHGISRLDHSLNVAHLTYKICRLFKIDEIRDITRAAILHDFFKNEEIEKHSFVNHPSVALKNAKRNFSLSKRQENMIASHMYPVSKIIPNNIGSVVITFSDKMVAIKEIAKYKAPLTVEKAFLFIFYFCIIPR
jgi:uncharacterized protein